MLAVDWISAVKHKRSPSERLSRASVIGVTEIFGFGEKPMSSSALGWPALINVREAWRTIHSRCGVGFFIHEEQVASIRSG